MSERYPIGKCASCGVNLVTAPEAKHESPQVCKSCRITELERDLATETEKREANRIRSENEILRLSGLLRVSNTERNDANKRLAQESQKREEAKATLARVMNEKDHRISCLKGKLALAQDDLSLRTQELTTAETRLTEAVAERGKWQPIETAIHRVDGS